MTSYFFVYKPSFSVKNHLLLFFFGWTCMLTTRGLAQDIIESKYPCNINFTTSGEDTIASDIRSDDGKIIGKSIWRVKKQDTLFEFYADGKTKSANIIKKTDSAKIIDMKGEERNQYTYELDGKCTIFFDDSNQNISMKGYYRHGVQCGEWLYFDSKGRVIEKDLPLILCKRESHYDSNGNLTQQIDKITSINEVYTVREAVYQNGKAKVLKDTSLFTKLFLRFTAIWAIILAVIFIARVFINSRIYNIENNTNFLPFFIFFPGFVSKNYRHSIVCAFSFWFSNYPKECRRLAITSNVLSMIFFILFFGSIISLTISGIIH